MRQEIATKLVKDTIVSLKAYYNTYKLLSDVEAVVKKAGITEEKAIDFILEKYFSNVEDSLKNMLVDYSGDNKSCTYFAYKMSMASNIFTESIPAHEKYSLMLGCRLQINYILRAVDSLTNIFSYCNFKLIENKLEEKLSYLSVEDKKTVMTNISDACDINNEYLNALKEANITTQELVKLFGKLKSFYVGHENILDDELLYAKFCSLAPLELTSLVQEYSSVIYRADIADLIESLEVGADISSIIPVLEDKINERSNGVTLFEDFQFLFLEAIDRENLDTRRIDITHIPFEIVAECIIRKRATDDLLGVIKASSKIQSPTSEFV